MGMNPHHKVNGMIYVGMDISKKTVDVQIKHDGQYHHHTIPNTVDGWQILLVALSPHDKTAVHCCCEYTGSYWHGIAQALHESGYKISVVNAYSIKHYARLLMTRNKTDKQDARLIADYCEQQQPGAWRPKTQSAIKITALNRRIAQLQKMRTMENNRQQVADDVCKASHQTLLETIDSQIAECEQAMQQIIDADSDSKTKQKLMESIPGIGKKTAAAFLPLALDIERFPTVKHFISYLGLSPVNIQSGKSVRGKTRISKMGDAYLRKALYMPARSACLRSKLWRDWAKEHMKTRHPKAVYVMMMRKLAMYIYKTVKENQMFDESRHKMA